MRESSGGLRAGRFAVVALAISVAALQNPARTSSANTVDIVIGPPHHVSAANSTLIHNEAYTGADPTNSRNLIACSIMEPPHPSLPWITTVAYLSSDTGITWHQIFIGSPQFWEDDPVCGFTPNGKPYVAVGRFAPPGQPADLTFNDLAFYTTDGSGGWRLTRLGTADREFVVTPNGPQGNPQLEYILTRAGMYGSLFGPKRISGLNVYRSDDEGSHFAVMDAYISSPGLAMFGQGGLFADGTLIAPLAAFPSMKLFIAPENRKFPTGSLRVIVVRQTYQNGIPAPRKIADLYPCFWRKAASYVPTLALDASSSRFRGTAYVAWADFRSGRCAVLLERSNDHGTTWTAPVAVSDYRGLTEGGPDEATPALAVNRDGILAALWYDRRGSPDDVDFQPRLAISRDGGRTFSRSLPLTDEVESPNRPMVRLETYIRFANIRGASRAANRATFAIALGPRALTAGETTALTASADGVFHPVWIDNHTGVEQLWTASVRIEASRESNPRVPMRMAAAAGVVNPPRIRSDQRACARSGFGGFAQGVAFDVADAWLDRKARRISMRIYVVNGGSRSLRLPVTFATSSVDSVIGQAFPLDASENVVAHPCWTFVGTNGTRDLRVGEASKPIGVVFALRNLRPFPRPDPKSSVDQTKELRIIGTLYLPARRLTDGK